MQGRKQCLLSVCSSVRIGSLALRSASWGILTKNRSVSSIFARVLVATPQFLHRRVGEGLQRRRIGGENEDSLSADEGGGRWNRQAMPTPAGGCAPHSRGSGRTVPRGQMEQGPVEASAPPPSCTTDAATQSDFAERPAHAQLDEDLLDDGLQEAGALCNDERLVVGEFSTLVAEGLLVFVVLGDKAGDAVGEVDQVFA